MAFNSTSFLVGYKQGESTGGGTGKDGKDGIGIQSVVETTTSTEDGGVNVVTVTLTNGKRYTFNVRNGSKGSAGVDGNDGAPGAAGRAATISVRNVTSGDIPSITNVGTATDAVLDFVLARGPQGVQGEAGKDGRSFSINGMYATVAALEAAHPTGQAGEAYFVGTAQDNEIYYWDVEKDSWQSAGPLRGLKGDDGFSPTVIPSVVAGGVRLDITNANGTQSVTILNGTDGNDGADGADGADGQDGENGHSVKVTSVASAAGVTFSFRDSVTNELLNQAYVSNGIDGKDGTSGDYEELNNLPTINGHSIIGTLSGSDLGLLSTSGGTMSGSVSLGNNKITNLADAEAAGDAVTKRQLDSAIVGALRPSGSIAFANLPAASLATLNNLYNITDAFTTTSDFVEGAGVSYPAGTNVAIINTGTTVMPTYKYDTYTGVIDTSNYVTKTGLAQSTGNSTDNAMSQAAITDAIDSISGSSPAILTITVGTTWTLSSTNLYTQVVQISGITSKSKVDLQLDATTYQALETVGVKALWSENNNGVVSIFCLGSAPSTSFEVQAEITETITQSGGLEIVPWSTGTDEQIAAMVAAMDDGTLSILDSGWQIGDERTVSLTAMSATGVGESHAAQSVTLVLMDSQHYDLVGGGKDHFVVGLKHSLNEAGYMNRSNTNSGSWDGSARRTWCNNVFRAAIPETLRACFKQFKTVTAETYNGSTTKISNDYFALFAEQEIFGSRTYSNTTEAAALTQIEYYKTSSHRVKNRSGSADNWWERSPGSDYSGSFCYVDSSGGANGSGASGTRGLAPFGCI